MMKQMQIQMSILTIHVAVLPVQVKERKVKITWYIYSYYHCLWIYSEELPFHVQIP